MDGFFIAKFKKFSNAIPQVQKGKSTAGAQLSCLGRLSQAASLQKPCRFCLQHLSLMFQMKNLLWKQQLRPLSLILSWSLGQKRRNLRDQKLAKSRSPYSLL